MILYLLHGDDHSIAAFQSDRSPSPWVRRMVYERADSPAVLDSLLGVLDLEDPSVGGEGPAGVVVAGSRRAHGLGSSARWLGEQGRQ